jgi:hypothetical protein
MGIAYNPRTITDGLVLCLDAANPKSYPGSGTAWTDLSGNGNTGTLVNGVGYSGDNFGSLSFDGTDDYGIVYSFDYESISNNLYSWEVWFKILSYSPNTNQMILTNISGVGYNDRLFVASGDNYMFWGAKNTSNQETYARAEFAPTINQWYHFVGTMNWGNSVKMYINGQLINENYNSIWGTKRTDGGDLYIGKRADGTNQNNAHCEISVFKWYARELNSTEIQQNYNALKGRFSI